MELDNPPVKRVLLAWTSQSLCTQFYFHENIHATRVVRLSAGKLPPALEDKIRIPTRSCNILDILNNFPLAKKRVIDRLNIRRGFVLCKRGTELSVRQVNFCKIYFYSQTFISEI